MKKIALDFKNQRALITGAGKGIGRDIAKMLAGLGAQIVALSRTEKDLLSLQKEIPCEILVADLADAAAVRKAAEAAGPIDLLVNNAAISILQPFLETTVDDFDTMMAINVRSVMIVSQVVASKMIARKVHGSIVNLSSIMSKIPWQNHTSYCTSKGALDQLTRMMALELGPHGIRVNAVNPTVVMTPMGKMAWSDPEKAKPLLSRTPIGRFAECEDVSSVVCFLLSKEAAMIHGVTLPIDGGFLMS